MGKQELWQWLAPTPEEAQEVFDRVGLGAAGFTAPAAAASSDGLPPETIARRFAGLAR